jgi:hypothetical protein
VFNDTHGEPIDFHVDEFNTPKQQAPRREDHVRAAHGAYGGGFAFPAARPQVKIAGDDAWRRVKPFRRVDKAKIRYLTRDECQRLVNAAEEELRLLEPLMSANSPPELKNRHQLVRAVYEAKRPNAPPPRALELPLSPPPPPPALPAWDAI